MKKKLLLSLSAFIIPAIPVLAYTMPDGYEPMDYVDREGNHVYVAIVNNDIYFQGLSTRYPGFTVKGTLNGSIASIPQWQFVERYGNQYDIYTRMNIMDYNEEDILVFYPAPPDYEYRLTVDLNNGLITCPKEDAFTLFGFATEIEGEWQWVDYCQNIYLKKYVDYTGVPVNPTGLELEKYEGDDFYSLMFNLPLQTTNGNPLSLYDTYYVIYVNGEEYTFEPDEADGIYEGVPYPLAEMPAYFTNGYDIITNGEGHLVGLYIEEPWSVGVQTVYKYGDVINKSEIVTLVSSGVESIGEDAEVVSIEYFDMSGRKVSQPEKGVYIKKATLSNGTTKAEKILK